MGGARWRECAGVFSGNKGEKEGKLKDASREGQGKLAEKLFL